MAGFLGINKKVAGAAKPIAPVKPAIKPIAKAPIAPVKPGVAVNKPAVKPVVKPIVKPQVKEEVEPKTEETTAVEEVVTLSPSPVQDDVAEVVQEPVVEETVGNTTEESLDDTTQEAEPKTVTEDKEEDDEEMKNLSPQQKAAITRKRNAAAKNRKQALEQHKEEVVATSSEYIPEKVPARSEMPYEEVISTVIISSAGQEWDAQVAELTSSLKAIAIEPDMNTATMKQAMADLVTLKDIIFSEYTLSKTILEATERKIDMVKGLNAKGSSADERKLNSLRACVAYEQDGININLFELLDVASAKHNFYNELMKQIEFKAKSLITMNGALKLEKDALGQI